MEGPPCFHDLYLREASDSGVAVFDERGWSDFQSDGGIEFQGVAAGGGLRISEHQADFLPYLVDEDAARASAGDRSGQFSHGLAHQSGVEADVLVAHFPLYFSLRGEGQLRSRSPGRR